MGPPKVLKKSTRWSERLRQLDYFEYRWSNDSSSYYYFNPYTGETIYQSSYEVIDRSKSMFALVEGYKSVTAYGIMLHKDNYASRQWGLRPFEPYDSESASPEAGRIRATNHIKTVWLGYLCRKALSQYFSDRYYSKYDKKYGYLFFHDTYDDNFDTHSSWYKPRLAFPWDITEQKTVDSEDHMGSSRYSFLGFEDGPYLKKNGIGKQQMKRIKSTAFTKLNPVREVALVDLKEIDFENTALGEMIPYFDGLKTIEIYYDQYTQMKVARLNNNWVSVFQLMQTQEDDIITQILGMRAMSSGEVPGYYNNELYELDDVVYKVLRHCMDVVVRAHGNRPGNDRWAVGQVHLIFTLELLANIFSKRLARAEFFNSDEVLAVGDDRAAEVDKFLEERIKMFNPFFTKLRCDTSTEFSKGSSAVVEKLIPTRRTTEIVTASLEVLCLLAEELETREKMATVLSAIVVTTMFKFQEEAVVQLHGLKLIYNLCYRCESGQEALLSTQVKKVVERANHLHGGDTEVNKQIRKVQLSLKEYGWRGNVDALITHEMKDNDLESQYLHSVQNSIKVSDSVFNEAVVYVKNEEHKRDDDSNSDSDNDSISQGKRAIKEGNEQKADSKDYRNKTSNSRKSSGGYKDDDDSSVNSDLTYND